MSASDSASILEIVKEMRTNMLTVSAAEQANQRVVERVSNDRPSE